MKHILKIVLSLLCFAIGIPTNGYSQIADRSHDRYVLTYQGMLDAVNGLHDGTHDIEVAFYSSNEGQNRVWYGRYRTTVTSGHFSLDLGSGDYPFANAQIFDQPLWIGVRINDSEEMRPLTRLTASPIAMSVADGTITSNKILNGAITADKISANYVGKVTVNGTTLEGPNRELNFVGGKGIELDYDAASESIIIKDKQISNSSGKGDATLVDPNDWDNDGNNWAAPAQWLGTTGENAGDLEFRIEDDGLAFTGRHRVMLYQAGPLSPNLTGGYYQNSISGSDGSTIAGGGGFNEINEIEADFGFIGGGKGNTITSASHYATIGGGEGHLANGTHATVSGGSGNSATSANYATVGGGRNNQTSGLAGTIAGGENNIANGAHSAIAGGDGNTASTYASVAGGLNNVAAYAASVSGLVNQATGDASVIGGGENNVASDTYSTVGGGEGNQVTFASATIAGGQGNSIVGSHAAIGGGKLNTAAALASIGGGLDNDAAYGATVSGVTNQATGDVSVIGGGESNTASDTYSTIGGGFFNTAIDQYTTVGGGRYNDAEALDATIGGGRLNRASGIEATVAGGRFNEASGLESTVGGGYGNQAANGAATIAGGNQNEATGGTSTVGGGYLNRAESDYSFIGGGYANNTHSGALRSTISGGMDNDATEDYTAITGGRNLIAQSYGQLVGGFYNSGQGSLTSLPVVTQTDAFNDRLFILGNGSANQTRQNAFEISYNGHSIVYDRNGSGSIRPAIRGASYQDNVILAWGDVTAPTNTPAPAGPITLIPGTDYRDFGVATVRYNGQGTFTVQLNLKNPDGTVMNLTECSIIASVKYSSCTFIDVSNIGAGNQFVITITEPNFQTEQCKYKNASFYFQVVGRQ